jgi:hypothetical protein
MFGNRGLHFQNILLMQPSRQPKHVLSTLNLLYFSLLIPILFLSVFFLVFPLTKTPELHQTMRFAVPLLSLLVLFVSRLVAGRRMKALPAGASLADKIRAYQASKLLKLAALEGAATLNVVVYGLTGNLFYLGFLAVLIVIYALERPTYSSMAIEIPLTPDEQRRLQAGTIEG